MQGLKNHPVLVCTGFTMCLIFSGLRLDAADLPVRSLNNEVLRLHGEMQRAVPGGAAEWRKAGAKAIRQGAAELNELAQKDPTQALSMALSPEVIADLAAKFPEAADQLERHGTWQGPVETWVYDYTNGSHRTVTRMKAG